MFHGAGEAWIRHVHVTESLHMKLGEFTRFTLLVILDDYYIGKPKKSSAHFVFEYSYLCLVSRLENHMVYC